MALQPWQSKSTGQSPRHPRHSQGLSCLALSCLHWQGPMAVSPTVVGLQTTNKQNCMGLIETSFLSFTRAN